MLYVSPAAFSLSFPAMITANNRARVNLPADIAAMLSRFGLTLDGLLTDNNTKLIKGAAIARAVIHHTLPARALAAAIDPRNDAATAPRGFLPALAALADQTGLTDRARRHNGCPWATGCRNVCLVWSGHGGLSHQVATARGRRTLAMIGEPETYSRAILWAIARQHAKAAADGLPLAVRLRGTDDTAWHLRRFALTAVESQAIRRRFGLITDPGESVSIADALATARADGLIKLYEYSKAATNGQTGLIAQRAAGFDVTASLAADRATAARDAMAAALAGFRIAIPIELGKADPLPARVAISHNGQTVILPAVAGDETDHRWADPAGVAVILRAKRSRGADPAVSGFILPNAPVVRLPDGLIQLLPV
jgi:hypothetical protein